MRSAAAGKLVAMRILAQVFRCFVATAFRSSFWRVSSFSLSTSQMNSCSFSRTTRTGQGAARTTRSAVLPMQKCFQPV